MRDTHHEEDERPAVSGEGWEFDTEPIEVRPRLGATLSVRLEPDDAKLVRRAARSLGLTQSEFIRRAARDRANDVITAMQERIVVGSRTTVRLAYVHDHWQEDHRQHELVDGQRSTTIAWRVAS